MIIPVIWGAVYQICTPLHKILKLHFESLRRNHKVQHRESLQPKDHLQRKNNPHKEPTTIIIIKDAEEAPSETVKTSNQKMDPNHKDNLMATRRCLNYFKHPMVKENHTQEQGKIKKQPPQHQSLQQRLI